MLLVLLILLILDFDLIPFKFDGFLPCIGRKPSLRAKVVKLESLLSSNVGSEIWVANVASAGRGITLISVIILKADYGYCLKRNWGALLVVGDVGSLGAFGFLMP